MIDLPPLSELNLNDLETSAVLRAVVSAGRTLAELKGAVASIPNEGILISALGRQEAKDSSAIENIITTHDDLFRSAVGDEALSASAKKVRDYAKALRVGYDRVRAKGPITNNLLIELQAILERNTAGFRRLPGTSLKESTTGRIVYTPPQEHDVIIALMTDLEVFINVPTHASVNSPIDPLVRMAIAHHRFESIHPFYDGNGRTGRILNVLFLVQHGLLDIPVRYLSRYIVQHKTEYYRLLQQVRDTAQWEPWLLYMLQAVEETARGTLQTIARIKTVLFRYKNHIRDHLPFYSQDLINSLFLHPYTRIDYFMADIGVSRPTAQRYLARLVEEKLLVSKRVGRSHYYINVGLTEVLLDVEGVASDTTDAA